MQGFCARHIFRTTNTKKTCEKFVCRDLYSLIVTMISLLRFCTLTAVVVLLSMQGQEPLGFHQKYLNLLSEDERRSYGFETTQGLIINDRI